jgi:hypothetical protein
MLGRFLVFAEIGAGHCAALEYGTGRIWYEDDRGFHETTLESIDELIERVFLEYDAGG